MSRPRALPPADRPPRLTGSTLRAEIARRLALGESDAAIARATGRSRSTVRDLRRKVAEADDPQANQERARAKRLILAGLSPKEIAAAVPSLSLQQATVFRLNTLRANMVSDDEFEAQDLATACKLHLEDLKREYPNGAATVDLRERLPRFIPHYPLLGLGGSPAGDCAALGDAETV